MSVSAVSQNASAVATAYRWRWIGLTVLLAAEAMNLLDATIVQVAAPVIHADLGGSVSDIQWFSAAYTLPFALLLVTGGRLGDIAGRRPTRIPAAPRCARFKPRSGSRPPSSLSR